jgi:hypothetical protein
MTKRPIVWGVRKFGAVAAVAAIFPAPLLSAQSFASPSTTTVAPTAPRTQAPVPRTQAPVQTPPMQPRTQAPIQTPPPKPQTPVQTPAPKPQTPVQTPAPKPQTPVQTPVQTPAPKVTTAVPTSQAPAPKATTPAPTSQAPTTQPKATTPAPTSQPPTTPNATTPVPTSQAPTTPVATTPAPTSQAPTTHVATTPVPTSQAPTTPVATTPAPTSQAPTTHVATTPVPTSPAPTTQVPAGGGSPTPSRSAQVTPGTSPVKTSPVPGMTTTRSVGGPGYGGTSAPPTTKPGQQSAVVTKGSTVTTVPVANTPKGVPASSEAIAQARVAPPVQYSAAKPPPVRVNFTQQVQQVVRVNTDRDRGFYRPRRWEYLDYDEYRRPIFFNPLATEMSFRYFYGGDYRTVLVPVGGRVILDAVAAGVYPITVLAGDIVSVASFLGGGFVPPLGWVGPPPVDWQPFQPVSYSQVPVDFSNLNRTVMVDQVTVVGHDDSLPVGQRDVVMLDGSTLARGEIQAPPPDGGAPEITLAQSQPLPGVGPWDNGQQYINTALETPTGPSHSNLPWAIVGVAAVLALLGGIAVWVWKRPHGDHALDDAPTDVLDLSSATDWSSNGGPDSDLSNGGPDSDDDPVSHGHQSSPTEAWQRPPGG